MHGKTSFMAHVATLLQTVYTILGRSSIKKGKIEELADVTEYVVLTFGLLNEVTWLSKTFCL